MKRGYRRRKIKAKANTPEYQHEYYLLVTKPKRKKRRSKKK